MHPTIAIGPHDCAAESTGSEDLRAMEEVIAAMDRATSDAALRHALSNAERHDRAQLAQVGTAYGHALGSQLVLLAKQRRLLAQLDAMHLADWDHPDIERENYHRCRALLDSWRTRRALLARAITGDHRALEQAAYGLSPGHRRLLVTGFAITAVAAGLLCSSAPDPRLAMISIMSVVVGCVAARHGSYAPPRDEAADAAGVRLLEAAFIAGIRKHDVEGARRASVDLGGWLAAVEADVLSRDGAVDPGVEIPDSSRRVTAGAEPRR